MEEISNRLKKSESRISQMHKKVLARLKNRILENPDFFISDNRTYQHIKKLKI
jgi:hypothetical protein